MNFATRTMRAAPAISLAEEEDFSLGPLSVRPSAREIVVGERAETVEPRVMQVLLVLARAAGHVVSREQLVDRCWGGRIVGDDAVNNAIVKVRALAGLSEEPAFEIETIPRVGYRLRQRQPDNEKAIPAAAAEEISPKVGMSFAQAEVATRAEAERGGALRRPASATRKFAVPVGLVALVAVFTLLAALFVTWSNRSRPPPGQIVQVAAVLPFTPLDRDRGAQAFADEVSADVADTLGRTEFSVISPARSFQFRGDAKAQAARALHADILVDGDVKRSGENLVVSVRVEDVASGLVLLSKEIQRPASQATDLPDQISTFVAGALGSDVSMKALNSGGNPQVRGEMLRAFFQCPYRQEPLCAYEIGRNLARMAPGNAMAQTMLAVETTNVLDRLPERERPEAIATARKAAWTAIRLDPHFGAPYIALGELASDSAATEAYLRRGLSIEPDSPSLAGYMSGLLLSNGRSQEALTVIQKVADRYSFQQFVPLTQIWALLQLGQADHALEIALHGQKLWPERGLFVLLQFEATLLQGNVARIEALINDPLVGPQFRDNWVVDGNQRTPPTRSTFEDIARALDTRNAPEIESVSRDCAHIDAGDWPHEHVCMLALVMLGRMDDVFRLPMDESLDNLLFFPQMAPLRADPRFRSLAEKLGLFTYWKRMHTRPDFCAIEHVPVCQALTD